MSAAGAGPVEFGSAELDRAIAARGLNPRLFRIKTEVATDPSESYRIAPGLITGGDLRGLMYGLLEAAEQVRLAGRLRKATGAPALAVRGIRMQVSEPGAEWLQSREYWPALFRNMVLGRFNRFHLALPRLSESTGTLRFITQTASEYGIDFTLGVWGGADTLPAEELQTALSAMLSACPSIRSVQVRLAPEAAMYAVRALRGAGRRVTLEVPAEAAAVAAAAGDAGVPVRIARSYPGDAPAAARYPYYWEISREAAEDGRSVAGIVNKFVAARAGGFEIDLPSGPEGAAAVPKLAWGRVGYDPLAK